jgi:hypothetical protein
MRLANQTQEAARRRPKGNDGHRMTFSTRMARGPKEPAVFRCVGCRALVDAGMYCESCLNGPVSR